MKRIIFFLFSVLFISSVHSQEIGFNTTDVGGEFQWHKNGTIYALHLSFNAKMHSSVQVRFGYNSLNRTDGNHDVEKGNGWGGSLGFRYYFKPFPHKFFIGARNDVWRMNIDWKEGLASGNSKLWMLQPTFEVGYLFYINDQVFITPSISNGLITNLGTKGEKVGKGFITLVGISGGVRF